MALIIPAGLVFLWVIFSGTLLLDWRQHKRQKQKRQLAYYLGYESISLEARNLGWDISTKEFFGMVGLAVMIGILLAGLFRNPLIILAGILSGYYLPRIIIQRYKKRQRMSLISAIPTFGRILIARLIDHQSITVAFEHALHDTTGTLQTLITEFIKDLGVGIGVQRSLENLKQKVGFRKFNIFAETLLIAHHEGYAPEALRALEKAIEAIENDIKTIETLEITTRKKKRELFYVVLASWAFPILLSFLNTDNANIYLDTLPGKVLMFSYLVATFFVFIKGDDYLSLKLDEL